MPENELGVEYIDGWGKHGFAQPEDYHKLYGMRPIMWLNLSVVVK